jgi:hypothetical protein
MSVDVRERWLKIARWIDRLHMPSFFAFVVLGALWLPLWLVQLIIALLVALQAWLRGCPLTAISLKFKRQAGLEQLKARAFVASLYERYGRKVGVVIFLVLSGWAILVARLARTLSLSS